MKAGAAHAYDASHDSTAARIRARADFLAAHQAAAELRSCWSRRVAAYYLGGGQRAAAGCGSLHTIVGTALVAGGAVGAQSVVGTRHRSADAAHAAAAAAGRAAAPAGRDVVWHRCSRPSASRSSRWASTCSRRWSRRSRWSSYVLLYTPLKLRTSLSTIVGAIPGALPAVIGWTAATNTLSIEGWVLFGIVFMWQMPHFLAIAWMFRDDYARAGIPLLPVIQPDGRTHGASGGALCGRPDSGELSADGRRPGERVLSGRRHGARRDSARAQPGVCGDAQHARGERLFFGTILYLPLLWIVLLSDHFSSHRVIDYADPPGAERVAQRDLRRCFSRSAGCSSGGAEIERASGLHAGGVCGVGAVPDVVPHLPRERRVGARFAGRARCGSSTSRS